MDKSVPSGSLTHYGVKGMKWGVTRSVSSSSPQARNSSDHTNASKTQDRIDNGGVSKVSNKDLQELVKRKNLEKQYRDLNREKDTLDVGQEAVKKVLGYGSTMNQVYAYSKTPMGRLLLNSLKIGAAYATGGGTAAAAKGAQIAMRNRRNHYTNVGN